jgi:hypothetical protein
MRFAQCGAARCCRRSSRRLGRSASAVNAPAVGARLLLERDSAIDLATVGLRCGGAWRQRGSSTAPRRWPNLNPLRGDPCFAWSGQFKTGRVAAAGMATRDSLEARSSWPATVLIDRTLNRDATVLRRSAHLEVCKVFPRWRLGSSRHLAQRSLQACELGGLQYWSPLK